MVELDTNIATLRRRALLAAVVHVLLLVVFVLGLGIALIESGTRFLEHRTAGTGMVTSILAMVEIGLLWHLVRAVVSYATDRPRVVPYFAEKYFDHQASEESRAAFRSGYGIAAELRQLDELAEALNVTPLSGFGFGDDLLKQTPRWGRVADGIRTVTSLIGHQGRMSAATHDDLIALAAALRKAAERQATFALLVRYGKDDFISGAEMQKREGTFWC